MEKEIKATEPKEVEETLSVEELAKEKLKEAEVIELK